MCAVTPLNLHTDFSGRRSPLDHLTHQPPVVSLPPSLQKSSQKADEYLREIKEQSMLGEAVAQCVEAAGHEYNPITQKSLLRVRTAPSSS